MKKLMKILMSLMLALSMAPSLVFAEDSETCPNSDTGEHDFGESTDWYNAEFTMSYDEFAAGNYSLGSTIDVTVYCLWDCGTTKTVTATLTLINSYKATCADDAEYYIEYTIGNSDTYSAYLQDEGSSSSIAHTEYDSDGKLSYYLAQDDDGNFYVEILCANCGTLLDTVKEVTVTSSIETAYYEDENGDYTITENWLVYTYTFTYDGKEYTDTKYADIVEDDDSSDGQTTTDSNSSSDETSSSDSVETADTNVLVVYAIIGLVALAGVYYTVKKEVE